MNDQVRPPLQPCQSLPIESPPPLPDISCTDMGRPRIEEPIAYLRPSVRMLVAEFLGANSKLSPLYASYQDSDFEYQILVS